MEIDAQDRLVQQIYGGVFYPAEWDAVLEALSEMLGFSQGCILLSETGESATSVIRTFNIDPDFVREYETTYSGIDPGRPHVAALGAGDWYDDGKVLRSGFKEHSAFYQEFMRPYGFRSNICANLSSSARFLAGLSFQSTEERPGFREKIPERTLSSLISHFTKAVGLRFQFGELSRRAMLGQALVDRIRVPVMIVNARPDVLYANASADAWLSNAGATGHNGARRQCLDKVARRLFDGAQAFTVLKIAGWTMQSEARLVGLPIARAHPLAQLSDEPLAMLIVHERGNADAAGAAVMAELYGLSKAEQRVVAAWAHHNCVATTAEELHVSIETVRTQLKSVFAKTGCDGQVDLARLLSHLSLLM